MKSSIIKVSLFILPMLVILSSCNKDNGLEQRDYQLTWSDEFEGEAGTSMDLTKWKYDVGTDWGNQQLEYDTDRLENVSLDGEGNLAIVARRENYSGSAFTSGRISSSGLFEQAYGRFEARIKVPYGPGIWPAFWLLGNNFDSVGWPQCGEIDIMEMRGHEPTLVNGTIHGPGYSAGGGIGSSYGIENSRFDADFHVYAIEWGDDYIDMFVDDVLFNQIKAEDLPGEWVYDHPFFIIMNVAVGGGYVGFPTDQTPFPQPMLIDYVRVYKEK